VAPVAPPRDETSPVGPDEFVYRRVTRDWYDSSLSAPIQRVAFEPHKKNDVDGLSLFRSEFVTPEDLAAAGPNQKGYVVARLRVSDILNLRVSDLPGSHLTVIPNPDPAQPRGHCLIPQLNSQFQKIQNKKARELEVSLAHLAGRDVVYIEPPRAGPLAN
jgi:hypothetical protein